MSGRKIDGFLYGSKIKPWSTETKSRLQWICVFTLSHRFFQEPSRRRPRLSQLTSDCNRYALGIEIILSSFAYLHQSYNYLYRLSI